MKFLEAANKFKKIRMPSWSTISFVENVNGSLKINCMLTTSDLSSDDWEEYKEPRKYLENNKEAMQALIDGKKISKDAWGDGRFFTLDKDGFIVDKDGDYIDPTWPTPNYHGKFYVVED